MNTNFCPARAGLLLARDTMFGEVHCKDGSLHIMHSIFIVATTVEYTGPSGNY